MTLFEELDAKAYKLGIMQKLPAIKALIRKHLEEIKCFQFVRLMDDNTESNFGILAKTEKEAWDKCPKGGAPYIVDVINILPEPLEKK